MRLKVVKGVGAEERKPSKKDNGFLSIEKLKPHSNSKDSQLHYLVYRNFLGATQFSALINPQIAKIKSLEVKPSKFQSKIAVGVRDPATQKYEIEHCMLSFITDLDRQTFSKVFAEVSGCKNE
jgi:hypothetical protein